MHFMDGKVQTLIVTVFLWAAVVVQALAYYLLMERMAEMAAGFFSL